MSTTIPKAKRGPALFDLLEKSQLKGPVVPGSPPPPVGRTKPIGLDSAAPAATGPADDPADSRPLTFHPSAKEPPARVSLFELDGDRIRVSLTSVTSAIALFIGLVVLFGIYELGRQSGRRIGFQAGHAAGRVSSANEMATDVEAARAQPPATHIVSGLLKEPTTKTASRSGAAPSTSGSPAASAGSTAWLTGYTYVVAQEFAPGRDEDARRAQEFLVQHGIETERVNLANGATLLVTRQGYNHKDVGQKQQSDQLLQKVRSVGAKYFAAGGGYKLEGYFRTRKAEGW